jgi:4-hydroxy-L-threonine phosphate dehydrogenase PdxA
MSWQGVSPILLISWTVVRPGHIWLAEGMSSKPTTDTSSGMRTPDEGGLLGHEEELEIAPGIDLPKRRIRSKGTLNLTLTETAYRLAARGEYDGVVAMYHDQATIPTKLVAFGEAVNVTVGLGYVRTSVDHGTGYDIAWRGIADPSGLHSTMKLALRLSSNAS